MSKNNKHKELLDVKFNPRQFDIKIEERGEDTNKYYNLEIKDKVTYVTYYRREVKPEELCQELRNTFKNIQEYRIWWKEISIREGEEVYI